MLDLNKLIFEMPSSQTHTKKRATLGRVPFPSFPRTNHVLGGGLVGGDTTMIATVEPEFRTIALEQFARGLRHLGYPVVTTDCMVTLAEKPQIILFDLGTQVDAETGQILLSWINYARRTNSIVIAGWQLDPTRKYDELNYLEDLWLPNYKTVSHVVSKLSNFIAVTALGMNGALQRRQNLCVSRATLGPGGKVAVDFQRNPPRIAEAVPRLNGGSPLITPNGWKTAWPKFNQPRSERPFLPRGQY